MAVCSDCNATGRKGWRDCPGCGGTGDGERWGVAAHEAGHVEVARALGATRLHARVDAAGGRGRFGGRFDGSKTDEAVILLAGAAAAEHATGRPHGGAADTREAQRLLRGSGTTIEAAQGEAARLVAENSRAIEQTARRLHRRGRI